LDRSISYPQIELRRRIGLPLDSLCGQDLVPARLYSDSLSSSATSRQGLGHFGNLRKPPPPTPGSVLSTLLRQYRAGRSLRVSPRVVAPLAGPSDRCFGQFFHPPRKAPSSNFCGNIAACISSTFPPTHPSSTLMKGFGPWRNAHLPIVARVMWRSWSKTSSTRSTVFVCQLRNYAAAYCNPECTLFCPSPLHYLCRVQ
jgi:hypothetical protein